jgi:multiple sugar transport system ATP-binding protein
MNFFPAKLAKSDGKLIVDGGSFTLQIPDDRTSVYTPFVGKAVILGIRPEDIHNPLFAPPGINAQPVEALVDVTELMGNEINVFLKVGQSSAVARVDPRSHYRINDKVQVVFNVDNMHIFDQETEKAVR